MRHTVKLPKLGDTATEVVVVRWYLDAGAAVAEGEALMEVETDKINVDVPSPVAGTLDQKLVEADRVVSVGEAVAVIVT
jgi:2-oxoglutarate dehydrogenase E2 component (dihydrolipoamide succinyltransferase)